MSDTLADRVKSSSRTRRPPKRLANDSNYYSLMFDCALKLVNKYKRKSYQSYKTYDNIHAIKQTKPNHNRNHNQNSASKPIKTLNNVNKKCKNKYPNINAKNILVKSLSSIDTQFPRNNVTEVNGKIPKNETTIAVLRAILTQRKLFEIVKTSIQPQICCATKSSSQFDTEITNTIKRYELRLQLIKSKKWCFHCLKESHRSFNCCSFGHYCSFKCRANHFIASHSLKH